MSTESDLSSSLPTTGTTDTPSAIPMPSRSGNTLMHLPSTVAINESTVKPQLTVMLRMQDEMNTLVFADWMQRGLAWHRAIYVEAAEFIDHLGWKWWKHSSTDLAQARMELVDIWHFGLSMHLQEAPRPVDLNEVAKGLFRKVQLGVRDANLALIESDGHVHRPMIHKALDRLIAAAGQQRFDAISFMELVAYCGMSFDDLFRSYVGKNQLNKFRQAKGYKDGSYVKTWDGKEDNVHLDELLQTLGDVKVDEVPHRIYEGLELAYRQLTLGLEP